MRRTILLTVLSFFVYCSQAQNDSTRLDVGGVVLKRAFTQNISIKGQDLEKMPFATLSEAINVWLYGSYTDASHISYVVDGNILSDVNSYSIHDIEEVVLVQNAAALTGLGGGQPQMVVITTRKGKGRSGIQGAAQTFLVHSPRSTTNLYHQYYLGAYRNFDKVSFGLSANYLRDAEPLSKTSDLHVSTPQHMDRWRLNGYFTWRPDRKNEIDVHAGFTRQTIGAEFDSSIVYSPTRYNAHYKTREPVNLFLPWLRWHGEWVRGLRNDLQAGLATGLDKGNSWFLEAATDNNADRHYSEVNATMHTDHVYIRDRLSYTLQAGGWSIEPAFNASYQHFKYASSAIAYNETGPNVGPGAGNQGMGSTSGYERGLSANLYVLIPAVEISYKEGINVQGGFTANVSHASGNQQGLKRVFPFASATVDLLGLGNTAHHSSLKLFGSYAQRDAFVFTDYRLRDLSDNSTVFFNALTYGGVTWGGGLPVGFPGVNNIKYFWVWQTGTSFAGKDNRWQLSYHLERLNFATLGSNLLPGGYTTGVYPEWKSVRHFLALRVRIVDKGAFSWESGLTATTIQNKTNFYPEVYASTANVPLGDHAKGNDKPSWTGGWTHRLRYKDLSVGVDMSYHFNREINASVLSGIYSYSRANTFLLQHIYIGYRVHLPGITGLEVYADSRGLVRSDKSNALDSRRYYGVGGKITI
ncbi:hypothetical protein Q4E93_30325 [Flavitalea sp. BT771]|uniref:hypothetical protein n=1 Tax=Flavitalea sp. BT771 TaxID=3063329 RepID=UPI0026E36618|nr:hypothetical protein [Flavitalea sp. BT771]MDO6434949.1 hypothetical protein [Flavitalea sp. BT771]MDV6223849.1 hypothetical protein [Flavitalea sp. BT771]